MRLSAFALLLLSAFTLIALPAPALADRTPVETHADRWLDQRDGEETYSEWAARNLTPDIVERLIGPAATGTKKQIADRVSAGVAQLRGQRMSKCARAAVELAHSQTLVMDRREIMVGSGQMLWGALSGAAGGAGAAETLTGFFGRELADKILGSVKQNAMDRAKNDIRDFFKRDGVETDQANDTRGPCKTFYRMVWDKGQERYDFIIVGDCGCAVTADGVRLARWSVQGSGSVIPSLHYSETQGISIRFDVGPATLRVTAACCDAQGGETYLRFPDTGESGDAWVGAEWRNAPGSGRTATPGGGGGTPRMRPVAEPEPPTTATVPLPPRADGELMTMPEDQFNTLFDKVLEGVESAQAASEAAERKLDTLRNRPGASSDDIRKAESERDAAAEARNEATRRRVEMMDTRRARNRAGQRPQQQQQQQQEEEQEDRDQHEDRRDRDLLRDPFRRLDNEERRRPRGGGADHGC